jgi:predicted phosphodiesterase
MPDSRAISILHLSDLHYESPDSNYGDHDKADTPPSVRSNVFSNLNQILQGWPLNEPVDIVAVTGDITTRGNEDGFAKFQEKTVTLLKDRLRNRNAFFLVPGNHDVRWGLDPAKSNYFDLKFESYSKLTREIGAMGALVPRGPLRTDSEPIDFAEGEPLYVDRLKRFVVLCVNSSIRCGEVNAALRKAFSSPFQAALAGVAAAAKELSRGGRSNPNLRHVKANLRDCLSVVEEQTLFDVPHITHPQLYRLATRLTTAKVELESDWSSYTKIALLHHHIVPFESQVPEYKAFAGTADAADLLDLLSEFGFQLVLTGHKHQAYIQEMSFRGSPLLIAGGATVGGQPVPGSFQGIRYIELRPQDSVVRIANLQCNWHGAMGSQVREQIEASEEYPLDRSPSRKRTYFPDNRIESAIQRQIYDCAFYKTDLVFEIQATEVQSREVPPKPILELTTELSYTLVNRTTSKCKCEIKFPCPSRFGEIVRAEFNGRTYDPDQRDLWDQRGLCLHSELEAGKTGRVSITATEWWRIEDSVLLTSFQPATDLKVVLRSRAPNLSFDFEPQYTWDNEYEKKSESGATVVRFTRGVLPNQGVRLNWKTNETGASPLNRGSASDFLPVK